MMRDLYGTSWIERIEVYMDNHMSNLEEEEGKQMKSGIFKQRMDD